MGGYISNIFYEITQQIHSQKFIHTPREGLYQLNKRVVNRKCAIS